MRAGRVGVAVLACWAALGLAGAGAYVHDYSVYRGYSPPRHPAGVPAGRLVSARFHSPALGRDRSPVVALPPGYSQAAARGQRFGVLYLLHGTSGSPQLLNRVGRVQVALDTLIAQRRIKPMIVVMVDGRDGTRRSDTEWADTPHGRYESLVRDTVRSIDKRFATVPNRDGRALAGLSAGGYGALNVTLRNLGVFATVESWSGYAAQTATGPFKGASRAQLRANSPASYAGGMAARLRTQPLNAFLYGGKRDPDTASIGRLAVTLRDAGARVTYRVYPGGHDWRLWRAHVPQMLQYAATHIGAKP